MLWTANSPSPREVTPSPGRPVGTSSPGNKEGISPCCGPPPAAPATREPRPWRRGPRAGAVWLCEERRGWAAAGAPFRGGRGPASAGLPAGRRLETAGLRHHPSSPGRRPASGTPRAPPERPPPSPRPSILEPGKEATRGSLPSLRATRTTSTGGPGRGRGLRTLRWRGTPRERAGTAALAIYGSARVQDGERR